ncbi:MAG: epoxyqueuosine reductase [Leptospirillum sp.]
MDSASPRDPGPLVRALSSRFTDFSILLDPEQSKDFPFFLEWLRRGDHGTMSFLERNPYRRRSISDGYPGYRTAILGLLPSDARLPDPEQSGVKVRIARYAVGRDYHRVFTERFKAVLSEIAPFLDRGEKPLIKPDHGAILEKSLAQSAGLGRIGRHTLLIHRKMGTRFTIGVMLMKTPFLSWRPPLDDFMPCGSCTLCLDSCPTQAFSGPFRLDARKCLSYLTIESPKSETPGKIPADVSNNWIFGCDICQEVCPYNGSAGAFSGGETIVTSPSDLIRLAKENPSLERVGVAALWKRYEEIKGPNANNFPKMNQEGL